MAGGGHIFMGDPSADQWHPSEAHIYINCLELHAAWLGLQAFCNQLDNTHIQLHLDNNTSVAYIINL